MFQKSVSRITAQAVSGSLILRKWLHHMPDSMRLSKATGVNGERRFVVEKLVGKDRLQAVFEVRPGKRNRSLSLVSLWIKR
jgi:hypothetical protein